MFEAVSSVVEAHTSLLAPICTTRQIIALYYSQLLEFCALHYAPYGDSFMIPSLHMSIRAPGVPWLC